MRLAAIWSLLYRLYQADGDSLGKTLPGYWSLDLLSFCVATGTPGQSNTWERTPTQSRAVM